MWYSQVPLSIETDFLGRENNNSPPLPKAESCFLA